MVRHHHVDKTTERMDPEPCTLPSPLLLPASTCSPSYQGWCDSYLAVILSPGAFSSEMLPQQQSMLEDHGGSVNKVLRKRMMN